ncbi:9-O-acetylesterase [candidate division KSB1 bacterium]|nr:9-O-acetylesterase [candidate division KSB1 bacterium]RQW01681.1 MAG: 9-O-acetylesterase [candidate division KSB1 bacterium]
MKRAIVSCSLLFVLFLSRCSYFAAPAEWITLPAVFTDNMVLQRDIHVPVWGKATPNGKVTVRFEGQKKSTVADENGDWQIRLDPLTTGGPFVLEIIGKEPTILANVLVGEVWVCSGQSNMEMPLADWGKIDNFEEEIAAATWSSIRLFQVQKAMSLLPQEDVLAEAWQECSPNTIPLFSAVGYFFGRKLYKELDVPIGLIHTSWGGTVAEAWTAPESLKQMEDFAPIMQELKTAATTEEELRAEYERKVEEWQKLVNARIEEAQSGAASWESSDIDDSDWKSMTLPILWESAGLPGFDGLVMFRKMVDVPDVVASEGFTLSLGPIDDQDVTFVNGQQVGSTDRYNAQREYNIPADIFKAGDNLIAVQVLDTGGGGGVWGEASQMWLKSASGTRIALSGEWKYKEIMSLDEVPPRPQSPDSPNRPTVLYNAMLEPLMPYAIRGAIWYQGESNAARAYQYRELFPTMINSWRANWGQGDFSFFFVQLANWRQRREQPLDSDWAELREAQTKALALPNTGMAVTIDIGDADDIHPKNKRDVGVRLALNALAKVYGKDIAYSGPMYQSMRIEGDKIILTFDHVDGGLVAKGGDLTGFAIAGEDKKFVWADAIIEGETVVVSNPEIENPVALRYAWADNPACNLYNAAGLPASPFRTDEWDGVTKAAK